MRTGRLVVVVLAASMLFACSRGVVPPPSPDSIRTWEQAPLEWARGEKFFVYVDRECRTMRVYKYGEWQRTYRQLAFGRAPGVKLHKGDKKTPRGLYKILSRRVHPRWSRFLLLDYPNKDDRTDHRIAFQEGRATASPGGDIGIHGSDEPILNETAMDWTLGCISLMNEDVRDFYRLVPDGTLVYID